MEILAQTREIFGGKVKNVREQGLIPAELYGHNLENIHLSVPAKEFSRVFKEAENTVIKLKTGAKEYNVLIHDVSKDALSGKISHIDFYAVKMDEKIRTRVPLIFVGEAPAVKEKGGVLIKSVQELEVESLPADLPHDIKVDLSSLSDIKTAISVKHLKIGDRVKLLADPETVVVSVIEQKEEETAPAIAVEEVKVETEEKKKEREKEKEEGKK